MPGLVNDSSSSLSPSQRFRPKLRLRLLALRLTLSPTSHSALAPSPCPLSLHLTWGIRDPGAPASPSAIPGVMLEFGQCQHQDWHKPSSQARAKRSKRVRATAGSRVALKLPGRLEVNFSIEKAGASDLSLWLRGLSPVGPGMSRLRLSRWGLGVHSLGVCLCLCPNSVRICTGVPMHFQTYRHLPATPTLQAMQQAVHGVAEESEKESSQKETFARAAEQTLGQENFGEVLVRYNEASGTSSVLRKPFWSTALIFTVPKRRSCDLRHTSVMLARAEKRADEPALSCCRHHGWQANLFHCLLSLAPISEAACGRGFDLVIEVATSRRTRAGRRLQLAESQKQG